MYSLFTVAGVLKTWQIRYCDSAYQECARYQQALRGSTVPVNLMPNGVILRKPRKPV